MVLRSNCMASTQDLLPFVMPHLGDLRAFTRRMEETRAAYVCTNMLWSFLICLLGMLSGLFDLFVSFAEPLSYEISQNSSKLQQKIHNLRRVVK
ncbi:hypothetical protein VNO77_39474 [Canavalia gladiata]|uniref:Uncharacterized protein n=1 Tax=Canavalia gladiata TaxID=3824 RepID=A0AAN9KAI3_CANGL